MRQNLASTSRSLVQPSSPNQSASSEAKADLWRLWHKPLSHNRNSQYTTTHSRQSEQMHQDIAFLPASSPPKKWCQTPTNSRWTKTLANTNKQSCTSHNSAQQKGGQNIPLLPLLCCNYDMKYIVRLCMGKTLQERGNNTAVIHLLTKLDHVNNQCFILHNIFHVAHMAMHLSMGLRMTQRITCNLNTSRISQNEVWENWKSKGIYETRLNSPG